MFVRRTSTHIPLASLDAGIAVVRDRSLPELRKAPGLKKYLLLVDRQSGNTMSLSFYGTEAELQAAEDISRKVRSEAISAAQATAPEVEHYEVTIEEHGSAPAAGGLGVARVVESSGAGPSRDEAVKYLREHVVPNVLRRKGLRSYYTMSNVHDKSTLGLLLYDSMANLKAAEAEADSGNVQIARDLKVSPIKASHYEVAISA